MQNLFAINLLFHSVIDSDLIYSYLCLEASRPNENFFIYNSENLGNVEDERAKILSTITITYHSRINDVQPVQREVQMGSAITIPSAITMFLRPGYRFKHWYYEDGEKIRFIRYGSSRNFDRDMHLYAVWEKDFDSFITEDFIPNDSPNSRKRVGPMTPSTITIHSVGNLRSTARNERDWLTNPSNTNTVGWHIVVDEREAIVAIPLNERTHHASDGSGRGNTQSIGLEIVESGDRERTLRNTIEVVAYYLQQFGWNSNVLRTHRYWDANSQFCPRTLLEPQNQSDRTVEQKSERWTPTHGVGLCMK